MLSRLAPVAALGIVLTLPVCADEDDSGRAARLTFVKERFAELTLTKASDTVPLKGPAEPLLRYTNPVRNSLSDGNIFLWLDGNRPVAACAWSIRGPEMPPKVWREFSSLTNEPLKLSRGPQVVWQPQHGGLCDQPVPDASVPSSKPAQRLIEMRAIARRFEGEFYLRDVTTQLRLMPQPIHRFQAPEQGTIDGALFGFVEANDPELLLMLEARGKESELEWHYTLAKMTSLRMSIRLDGREVFAPTAYWGNPRTIQDPYMEAVDGTYRTEERPQPILGKGD